MPRVVDIQVPSVLGAVGQGSPAKARRKAAECMRREPGGPARGRRNQMAKAGMRGELCSM
eukprot:11203888-Lingulodinium_polyedra.AAC.1